MTTTTRTVTVDGYRVACEATGAGAPVLLLHGFPQTRAAWRAVAPRLADRHEVVVADLPGYGDSERLGEGPEAFAKARMAEHLVAVMAKLGHDRFAVIGHDRGGLVAFRAALDHPQVVTHLGVLDILPASDTWAALRGVAGVVAFHLYLLAQPGDLPERMLAADPEAFFGHFLDAWTKVPGAIPSSVRQHYLAAAGRPQAIHGICDDYRASAFIDPAADDQDRAAGTGWPCRSWPSGKILATSSSPSIPRRSGLRGPEQLTTLTLPCGHFLPEEQPAEIAQAIARLLDE